MPIECIHTYLVHPGKAADDAPNIGGTPVVLNGRLFDLLAGVYEKSSQECDIDISFNPSRDGAQNNPCRDLIVAYLQDKTLAHGRRIAERLQTMTDHRSGLGLLFLIAGKVGNNHKLVVSRFPADSAILAEENQQNLTVEFLERVFMKSATAYKAALYEDSSFRAGFWLGRAVDKQINSRVVQLSNYWIADFLDSDFRSTSSAATRRLAAALRSAAKKTGDVDVKSEIASAVTLAGGLAGRTLSIHDFENHFGLSDVAREAIADEIRQPALLDERFRFNPDEFKKQIAYRSVELDSGGMLTAQVGEFDNVFQREVLDEEEQKVRYSTEGKVVNEKFGKSK